MIARATHAGFAWPSTSTVYCSQTCSPPSTVSTSSSTQRARTRLPEITAAGKAQLVEPVVDDLADALEDRALAVHEAAQHRVQRQGQVAVRNGRLPRRLAGRPLRIDVDPLVVARRRRKRVDALLGHLEPIAAVDFLPDLLLHALQDQLLGHDFVFLAGGRGPSVWV